MAWYHRLFNLARGDGLSRDIDRELQFHLAEKADELMAQGMSRDEAWREAERRFGHRQLQRDNTRDMDVLVWLESLLGDVRYALRSLRLSPGFAFIAVLSIALGVGANTAIFSLINAVMLKSLPVSHPEELVKVMRVEIDEHGKADSGGSYTNPLWEQIRDHQDAVDAFAYGDWTYNLANGGEARKVNGAMVSGSYFPVLGARALAGRLFVAADDQRGCPATAVVSPGFAAREFGAAEGAVGRSVLLDGHPFEVVGVTDPSFFGVDVGRVVQVYTPICTEPIFSGAERSMLDRRSTWWLQLMGRPRPRLTLPQVNEQLAAAAPGINTATLPTNWPASALADYQRSTFAVSPAATGFSDVRGRYSDALYALMVLVSVVLLIACTNVAHLLLARASARQREMAVRQAIGAGRGRLVRQLLTESLLLALLGAGLGILFARWASELLVRMLSTRGSAVWLNLSLDTRVLAFTIGVATVTGVLFGLVPAWRAARIAPHTAMQGRSAVATRGRFALTKGLVVGQVALSLVLLVAAGLLLRSFQKLLTLDPGFQREGVLLVRTDIANAGYADERRLGLYTELLEQLRALPGVRSASASLLTPVSGAGWNGFITSEGYTPKYQRENLMWFNGVSEHFFETMGTRRVAGRDFGPQDVSKGTLVAAVSESFARRVYGSESPIGKTFRSEQGAGQSQPIEIIAVVQDAKYRSLRDTAAPTAYLPLPQSELWGTGMNFELRFDNDPAAGIPMVKALFGRYNHAISLDFTTMEDQVSDSLTRPRLLATLSAFFGTLALLLATVGLYGTVAYSVARRHNEIGIRIALGAERSRVLRMVLGEVAQLLIGGGVLGLAIALIGTRLLKSFLFGLTPTDPFTLGLSLAAIAVVSLAAGALPAWRAARLDPMEALRED